MTCGKPSGPILIASKGQALAQVPSPRQPMVQTFVPPPSMATFFILAGSTPSMRGPWAAIRFNSYRKV